MPAPPILKLKISFFSVLIRFSGRLGSYVDYVIMPATLTRSTTEKYRPIPSNLHLYSTEKCNASYEPTFEDNLNHIRANNLSAALPLMEKLQLNERPLSTTFLSHVRVPIFVTGCSSNHFKENMGLLKNIEVIVRPVYKDLKIIVFDLGLTKKEEIEQVTFIFLICLQATIRFVVFDNNLKNIDLSMKK